jgi:hypothetical protein
MMGCGLLAVFNYNLIIISKLEKANRKTTNVDINLHCNDKS